MDLNTPIKIAAASAVAFVFVMLFALQYFRDATVAFIARFGVPIMMTISYVVLAITSGTDATGIAWLSLGLAFVMVVWFIVRTLMTRAALARALAVGDHERILELADAQIRQRRGTGRVPYQVAKVRAYEQVGDWPNVIAEIDRVESTAQPLLTTPRRWELAALRAGALVELARPSEARDVLTALGAPPKPAPQNMDNARAWIDYYLAAARVAFALHEDTAARDLQAIVDNIRATAMQRAIAHHYLARLALTDAADDGRHAEQARRFAPPNSWLLKPT